MVQVLRIRQAAVSISSPREKSLLPLRSETHWKNTMFSNCTPIWWFFLPASFMIASLSNYLRMRAKTTTARLTRMRCCARLYVHEVTHHGTIVKKFWLFIGALSGEKEQFRTQCSVNRVWCWFSFERLWMRKVRTWATLNFVLGIVWAFVHSIKFTYLFWSSF